MKAGSIVMAFLLLILTSHSSAAQTSAAALPSLALPPVNILLPNYDLVPIGEIGGLEGGAFIVRANDSSAAFYNPAGLTKAEQTSVSGTAGVFQFGSVSGDGLNESGQSFQQVPAMFAFVLKDLLNRNNMAAGFSVARVGAWKQTVDFEQTMTGAATDRLSYSSAAELDTWLASAGVGYSNAGKWRVGGSLDVQYTSTENRLSLANQFRTATDLTALLITSRSEASAAHLRFTLGTQYELRPTLSVAAVVRSGGLRVMSSGLSTLEGLSSGSTTTTASFFDDDVDVKVKVPFEFKTGLAYTGPRAQVEVDLLVHGGAGEYQAFTSDHPVRVVVGSGGGTTPAATEYPASPPVIDSRAIANVVIGGQFKLTSGGSWAVHGGYGTSQSPVGPHDTVFTKINLQRLTAGLSARTSHFLGSLGIQYVSGASDPVLLRELPTGQLTTTFHVKNLSLVYSLSVMF